MEDPINRGGYGLDFEPLIAAGGRVFWMPKPNDADILMHHKFCVVDHLWVINGSYNWTRRAQRNHENITVMDDPDMARQFLLKYEQLKVLVAGAAQSSQQESPEKALLRLQKLTQAFRLGDDEDIRYEARKLSGVLAILQEAPWLADAMAVLELVERGQYGTAAECASRLVASLQSLTLWQDPEVPALQLELESLMIQLASLETEKAEMLSRISHFERMTILYLGSSLAEAQLLKKAIAEYLKQQNPEDEQAKREAREAEEEYEAYRQARNEAENNRPRDLDEAQQKDAKNRYLRAAKVLHPDRADESEKDLCEKYFKELQHARSRNDLDRIIELQEDAEITKANALIAKGQVEKARELVASMPPSPNPTIREFQTLAQQPDTLDAFVEKIKVWISQLGLIVGASTGEREKVQLLARVQQMRKRVDKELANLQALAQHKTWKTICAVEDPIAYFDKQREVLTRAIAQLRKTAEKLGLEVPQSP
jgi:hypothetical protein